MSADTLFDADETLTVAQVHRRLGETIKRTFSAEVWVQGQIRNLSRSARGHVYFDLCDRTAAGAPPKASIAVTLFDSNRQVVNRIIGRTGNSVRMDDGVEVRIRARVELYPPRGQLQLNMTSIDPEFTLGRLGADRERLLQELRAENLFDANRRLPLPLVPLRVALITSVGSAAHADFEHELAGSIYNFGLEVLATRVQGEFAAQEIADMVAKAQLMSVDVIAIVRGGGARTDLAAFDTEPVARAIAACSLPVVSGIGHEVDTSVADLLAHTSLKTPTACARFLIEQVAAFDSELAQRAERLVAAASRLPELHATEMGGRARSVGTLVERQLHRAGAESAAATSVLAQRVERAMSVGVRRLDSAREHLASRAQAALTQADRRSSRSTQLLLAAPGRAIKLERSRMDLLAARLSAVDPAQALRRGYSITTTETGTLVRNSDTLHPGDRLVTRLASGSVHSAVTRVGPVSESQDPS